MGWFQLDPERLAERARLASRPIPTLGQSIYRGAVGFTAVSVAGFAPWVLAGDFLHHAVGEAGMYIACLLVFLAVSGPLMHRLIIGRGSLPRFYKLFTIAFAAYAVVWIVGWMALRGHAGSIVGLLAGTAIMAWILCAAFEATAHLLPVFCALFFLNTAGYFVGGWVEAALPALQEPYTLGLSQRTRLIIGMFMWGVCYGLGLGAGLGFAFHRCQSPVRKLLALEGRT